jgi:non-ribosomal peptide synthetase component E (peptide arylation enzyme)
MANVFRRIFSSDNLTVDLIWSDVGINANGLAPFDVVGCQCFNPDGKVARLVLSNASGSVSRVIPRTQPGVPYNIPAPPALQMIEEQNYHGATVLNLSHGATLSLQTR